jgi:endo-1,4-beta-D-glucanase Y
LKNRAFLVFMIIFSDLYLRGQSRPFPQSADYPYGYKTSVISAIDVQIAYERWKKLYLKRCDETYRVCRSDTATTISEGMGYGMLLTAYLGERQRFDRLFDFYKSKRTSKAHNLMAWQVTCTGIKDSGSATDGDIDAAFALLVAYDQWGGDYLTDADSILAILKDNYFVDTCDGNIYVMKPGGHWGGCDRTDISYYCPGYFRVFAKMTGDSFWDGVADDVYTILNNGADSATGLVPDWQSWDGVPGGTNLDWPLIDYYRYDACRVPWRMALDYVWNGDSSAQSWCYKISDFANSIGAENIVDGYELDGTPHEEARWNNSPFVGGFAVGAMAHSQAMVDSFASRLLYLDGTGEDDQYFNLSLRCLYMLVLTGNFWKPEPINKINKADFFRD